jgi:hypothetical protein
MYSEDDVVCLHHVVHAQSPDLKFNVGRLITDGDLCDAWKVDNNQVWNTRAVDGQTNGLRRDAFVLPCHSVHLFHDL